MIRNFDKLILESLIDSTSYDFKTDENGNIFCTFTTVDYVINAIEFNKNLSFTIVDKNGNNKQYTEKEFSFEFPEQYKKFKEELQKYKNSEDVTPNLYLNIFKNISKIKNFNDQLKETENNDPNVKLSKDIEIDGTKFNFKILNDLMVENYCQCIFEIFDEKQNKQIYVKSLIFVKRSNSTILKIILQDEKGQVLMILTSVDFKINYLNDYKKFKKAIIKFDEYFNTLKK